MPVYMRDQNNRYYVAIGAQESQLVERLQGSKKKSLDHANLEWTRSEKVIAGGAVSIMTFGIIGGVVSNSPRAVLAGGFGGLGILISLLTKKGWDFCRAYRFTKEVDATAAKIQELFKRRTIEGFQEIAREQPMSEDAMILSVHLGQGPDTQQESNSELDPKIEAASQPLLVSFNIEAWPDPH